MQEGGAGKMNAMDTQIYWRVEANGGKVIKSTLSPLFTDKEISGLNTCYWDDGRVYIDQVINKCYAKGLEIIGISNTSDTTTYHLLRTPVSPPTIITERKET